MRPQAEPVLGTNGLDQAAVRRPSKHWISPLAGRKQPARLFIGRRQIKVEQTRGTSFGYRVREAREEETPDLNAFTVSVPDTTAIGSRR